MNCCICGPVKNCGPYLKTVLNNIEQIGSLFDDYIIILFYDHSTDDTLQILKNYSNKPNSKLFFYVNKKPVSKFRTHNIAFARNWCHQFVKKNHEKYPFFIMMDFDDVNCKNINTKTLEKYLKRENWDALSFQTSPHYYDILGLYIWPYCFSYKNLNHNVKNYDIIQKYVEKKLSNLPPNGLLPCISAFNGFAIYRTHKFLNTYYDGRIRSDLIPLQNMKAHMAATKSNLVYKKYVTVDGRYEDCEHRAFHIQARQNSRARIMISPEILFY